MYIIYGIKHEKKYLGNFFGDTAPTLDIQYQSDIPIALVSVSDFESWFGNHSGIGILRDFAEYNEYTTPKRIISIKSSENVKTKTLIVDEKYKKIFGQSFKCIPIHTPIKSIAFIKIFLSSNQKIEVVRDDINTKLRKLLLGQVLTSCYNNIIYDVDNIISAKIYDISHIVIINESTSFHLKSSDNVIVHLYTRTKYEPKLDIPIEVLMLPEVVKPTLTLDFSKLKVGGLRAQLEQISNVIRPRGIKQEHLDKIGMTDFEKGIILYGPSGTGKTTIARELSKILGVKNFTVVNGPELITKYIGESEANIRKILQNYTDELKVVFFDEFDCLAKERTSDGGAGSSVANNIVNQILAIMDGVDQNNNLLIIAATNRIDVIDMALLRPGRFGLCLYIGLPNKIERVDIFNIHLSKNIEQKTLENVDFLWLANKTENYSGAEIKGVCKKAREIALAEAAPDLCQLDKIDINKLNLTTNHFELALNQVKCTFAGNYHKCMELLPSGNGDPILVNMMIDFCLTTLECPRIYTFLLSGDSWTKKSSSCRVVCDKLQEQFDSILIITDNLISNLNKIELNTGKKLLIVLDSLENLCGLLNHSSYNARCIEAFNKFVGHVVSGKVILIATMRTKASDMFSIINPSFEWNKQYII
ncbi:MAG TPA: ATP-binding protein [Candidatus Saccharimonadales bacterium]|nr:ATP-binding protein [Candidatus Saccharimonadales bacterium]